MASQPEIGKGSSTAVANVKIEKKKTRLEFKVHLAVTRTRSSCCDYWYYFSVRTYVRYRNGISRL